MVYIFLVKLVPIYFIFLVATIKTIFSFCAFLKLPYSFFFFVIIFQYILAFARLWSYLLKLDVLN